MDMCAGPQIEKDYVLGWLLAGIAHHPDLVRTWIFKGGTWLVERMVLRPIGHQYSDKPLPGNGVFCYSLTSCSEKSYGRSASDADPVTSTTYCTCTGIPT